MLSQTTVPTYMSKCVCLCCVSYGGVCGGWWGVVEGGCMLSLATVRAYISKCVCVSLCCVSSAGLYVFTGNFVCMHE